MWEYEMDWDEFSQVNLKTRKVRPVRRLWERVTGAVRMDDMKDGSSEEGSDTEVDSGEEGTEARNGAVLANTLNGGENSKGAKQEGGNSRGVRVRVDDKGVDQEGDNSTDGGIRIDGKGAGQEGGNSGGGGVSIAGKDAVQERGSSGGCGVGIDGKGADQEGSNSRGSRLGHDEEGDFFQHPHVLSSHGNQ